jgi:hypothetical protein
LTFSKNCITFSLLKANSFRHRESPDFDRLSLVRFDDVVTQTTPTGLCVPSSKASQVSVFQSLAVPMSLRTPKFQSAIDLSEFVGRVQSIICLRVYFDK